MSQSGAPVIGASIAISSDKQETLTEQADIDAFTRSLRMKTTPWALGCEALILNLWREVTAARSATTAPSDKLDDCIAQAVELHQFIEMLPYFGELQVKKIAIPSETIAKLQKDAPALVNSLLAARTAPSATSAPSDYLLTLADKYEKDGQAGPLGENCWGWRDIAKILRNAAALAPSATLTISDVEFLEKVSEKFHNALANATTMREPGRREGFDMLIQFQSLLKALKKTRYVGVLPPK